MANVNHSTMTDPYLHEPKGVAAASNGSVYVANGAGTGSWVHAHHYIGAYVDFDAATPAYQHSTTTTLTPLDPTFVISENNGFAGVATPNARLQYTEVESIVATVNFTMSIKNNSGSNKDVEFVLYKNGVAVGGAHNIQTVISGEWSNCTLVGQTTLDQNDYIEILVKADANFTLDMASAYLTIAGNFKA